MKVITWNINKRSKESPIWDLLSNWKPDLILLQEAGSMPDSMAKTFNVLSKVAINKDGKPQRFSTAVLANKDNLIREIKLESEFGWVNKELDLFKGNFISCTVKLKDQKPINVVSVYSPAWPVAKERLKGIDTESVKLKYNPNVWGTEIIWSALKNTVSDGEQWIVGGDFNSSETLDRDWQDRNGVRYGIRSSGNKEILDRMKDLKFTECLREFNGRIVPTFRNNKSGEIAHQIDHLFVTNDLYNSIKKCSVGDKELIFSKSLSDHLPIIAEFR